MVTVLVPVLSVPDTVPPIAPVPVFTVKVMVVFCVASAGLSELSSALTTTSNAASLS